MNDIAAIITHVETGGFDSKKCAVVEVGLLVLDKNLEVLSGDTIPLIPDPGTIVEPTAAAMNGYDAAIWAQRHAIPSTELYGKLEAHFNAYHDLGIKEALAAAVHASPAPAFQNKFLFGLEPRLAAEFPQTKFDIMTTLRAANKSHPKFASAKLVDVGTALGVTVEPGEFDGAYEDCLRALAAWKWLREIQWMGA